MEILNSFPARSSPVQSRELQTSVFFIVCFTLSFQSHQRCSNSFIMFWNEIKLQERFSHLKASCGDAKLNLTLCQIYIYYNTFKSYSR